MVAVLVPSVTETWKTDVYAEVASTAVKVGDTAVVLESVCAVPLDRLHTYARDSVSYTHLRAHET